MIKGLGQLASLLKNANDIQGRMQEMQEGLKRMRLIGTSGGGMVAVEVNGHQQVLSCRIEESLFSTADREMIEDLIVAACNQALAKVRDAAAAEMGKLAGGIDVPGLGDALAKLGGTGLP